MVSSTEEVKLKVRELEIFYRPLPFKGRLFAATPTSPKPRDTDDNDWCDSIVAAARLSWSEHIVIPLSFWPNPERSSWISCNTNPAALFFDVIDDYYGIKDHQLDTPYSSIRGMLDSLICGENILILSATKKISGFIPAILTRVTNPEIHIEKLCYPIISEGYELSPYQVGYLCGLTDTNISNHLAPK